MMLSDIIDVNKRFARSANVERDRGAGATRGYIPTGRATDVVERIARGLADPAAGRSVSITGPHGAGKSSLALFLSALTGPVDAPERADAFEVLRTTTPAVADLLQDGLRALDPAGCGFVRAMVTAEREPIGRTIARALHAAATEEFGLRQRTVPASFADRRADHDPQAVLDAVRRVCQRRPLLLVIDEFGKNLEAYAGSRREGDPYLLQELAEAAAGQAALPMVVITMQHLAFEEYVHEATAAQRREWAKIQGRFQDIPYVETAGQSRRLIAASFTRGATPIDAALESWFEEHGPVLARAGLAEVASTAEEAYPLHPLTVAVLPDLCSRYGQNERTLFSFLAGPEPRAVPRLMEQHAWESGDPVPFIGLDAVYDYFLDSAATSIAASSSAGRWLEVESRIRDATGLSELQLRTLKSVGVLNLAGSAGSLRASAELVGLACAGLEPGAVAAELRHLETLGLLTYREFADEYRLWEGSDYDLRASVEVARRSAAGLTLAALLNEAAPPAAVVATRHSHIAGVLRVFEQRYADGIEEEELRSGGSAWDGTLLLLTEPKADIPKLQGLPRPVAACAPHHPSSLRETALEAVALRRAVAAAKRDGVDRVALRELSERMSGSVHRLRAVLADVWNPQNSAWFLVNDGCALPGAMTASAAASAASDRLYTSAPRLRNEMIARRELTSQGAKARRMLMEAFLAHPEKESFGIEGYGPEKAMYEAVFRSSGIHRKTADGWQLALPPKGEWRPLWQSLLAALRTADLLRTPLSEIASVLTQPPIGLKDGIVPLLLLVALVHDSEETALYEHGSLVLKIDDAVAERMGRNLSPFSVKHLATTSGARREALDALQDRLGLSPNDEERSFLYITRALFNTLRRLEPYAQRTRHGLSERALAVRASFLTVSEPDELLFAELPRVLGHEPFGARDGGREDAAVYADDLAGALRELQAAYPALLDRVRDELAAATASPEDLTDLRRRAGSGAGVLLDSVLEPRLRALLGALARQGGSDRAWLENVAMVVAEGTAPRFWTDEQESRFRLQAADLGGAMRRTQALLYDRLAGNSNEFDAFRVTITRPDGQETDEVVTLTPAERDAVATAAGQTMTTLTEVFGGPSAARGALMAWLAGEGESAPTAAGQPGTRIDLREVGA
jgi:hypothetical protein